MFLRSNRLALIAVVVLAASHSPAQPTSQPTTPVKPMAADAHPSFAVATIKPHDPASQHQGFNAEGDRFTIRNQTVASLMSFAYSIHWRQIVDAPDWALHDRWDIEGKTNTPGEPNLRQQQEMLQKLLADRFQLKFHRDHRELPVYAIHVAKGGPKLKPAANPNAEADQEGNGHGTEQTVTYTSASMTDFAFGEQFFFDRPVIDQTGLSDRYDFSFRYTYDETKTTDPNAPPGIFTAVQEQLGLKFDPTKASTDVFVLDHIEQPSAN
jgi:uncharacterized protein (TIGR03435 family)